MPRLSECTDRMLLEQGLVSLHELASEGVVIGGPEARWCWGGEEAHDYSIRLIEDDDAGPLDAGEQYEMCSRCNHVRLAPYLEINGVAVSRHPQPDPRDPMPIAWPAPVRPALEGPR